MSVFIWKFIQKRSIFVRNAKYDEAPERYCQPGSLRCLCSTYCRRSGRSQGFPVRFSIFHCQSIAYIIADSPLGLSFFYYILMTTGTPIISLRDGILECLSFADVHVHFREPGFTQKETILTGSRAAARGGYTIVCPMPNLHPVPDSMEHLEAELEAIRKDAVIKVLPYGSITKGRKGFEIVDFAALRNYCVAFSDDGSGVQDGGIMREAMQEAKLQDVILAAHCEDNSLPGTDPASEWRQIARDLELCAQTGCHYHVCHISSRESARIIRQAKSGGVNVTCETAPHYLTLCREDITEDSGRFKMNPPLREAADREALIEALQDGTIDVIATDHAPHTAREKSLGFAGSAMGIVGLETSFPVLYTRLVRSGRISLERLLEAMCSAPRRIFRMPWNDWDTVTVGLEEEFTIDSGRFASMGKSTPFEGWRVYGKVLRTTMGNKTDFEENL